MTSLRLLVLFVLLLAFAARTGAHNVEHLPNWLLLISMDGFRHDYIDLAERAGYNVSAFRRLQREGITGGTVLDDFVSKTFPNHYTIATGLHEESHGVVGNIFYDPDLKRVFTIKTNSDSAMWSNGSTNGSGPEPLWVTAQRQKLHSAVINWPSSAAKIRSAYPTYSFGLYDHDTAMQAAYFIERIASWFESDEHCRLALLYLPEPDASGHSHGPGSKEVLAAVQLLNGHLSRLLDRLASSRQLRGRVNIVLTSDHGMTELDASKAIFMDEIADRRLYDETQTSRDYTAWHVWPRPGQTDALYQKLLAASATKPFSVMRRGDPRLVRSRYNYNRRIAPITVLADLHAAIVWNRTCEEFAALRDGRRRGDHGYNSSEPDMHPIFLGWGPAFAANRTVSRVRLVDIYAMCCRLLDIRPAASNGSVGASLLAALRLDHDDDEDEKAFYLSSTLVTTFASFLLVACFTSVFALGALRAYRTSLYRRNRRFGLLDPAASANHDSLPLSLDDDDL